MNIAEHMTSLINMAEHVLAQDKHVITNTTIKNINKMKIYQKRKIKQVLKILSIVVPHVQNELNFRSKVGEL